MERRRSLVVIGAVLVLRPLEEQLGRMQQDLAVYRAFLGPEPRSPAGGSR
jgi:hypothetical protein